jgi:putative endonuclease
VGRRFESSLGSKLKEIIKVISFWFAAMFYVYILYSYKSDRYYIGHTIDVYKRLDEHNNPQKTTKYSSKHLPWVLVLSFMISESRGEAMLVERFIKNQKSRDFIKKLICEKNNLQYFEDLKTNILKRD